MVTTWLAIALAADPAPPAKVSTVFLVRHAEKVSTDAASELTEAGKARAEELARVLGPTKLTAVFSTDTVRTKATAEPTAKSKKLEVQTYKGTDPTELIAKLRAEPGNYLIVGHSNTVPTLAHTLSIAMPYEPLPEWQYDQLYVMTLPSFGEGSGAILSYGQPSVKQ